jgi:phosphatidylserine/phosphatidylglycerophosphate/cardiolipin synthase-like enzyme
MSNTMKHEETVHVNEIARTAKGTVQWFLDKENTGDAASHSITHNNRLTLFINGEEGFASIAADIQQAKKSIDLCCWGFDPAMELVRGAGSANALWPRGTTYGDMLIEAGKRGVQVRLLVWLAPKPTSFSAVYVDLLNPMNLPGWTHDTNYFAPAIKQDKVGDINALKILEEHRKANQPPNKLKRMIGFKADSDSSVARKARSAYCSRWFRAGRGLDGSFTNISVRHRDGNAEKIGLSMGSERIRPDQTEWIAMTQYGTHHQKTILIDYAVNDGKDAVGYVMGLNSVTDYWDTVDHAIEDTRREDGSGRDRELAESVQPLTPAAGTLAKAPGADPDAGFRTFKPYRDYACRIQGGALISVHKNFESAWLRTFFKEGDKLHDFAQSEEDKTATPAALRRKPKTGNSSVQIVRTQPEESDKTIKDMYFQATSIAVDVGGYLYMENQYFQYEEWAQRVITHAKEKAALWKSAARKKGKSLEDMPALHVFIVIPVAERGQMVPRTYDTLATLGQQGGMTGQSGLVTEANEKARLEKKTLPNVVQHANTITKPNAALLEGNGLRIVTSMLQTSGSCIDLKGKRRMRYREIYIHSKLMLINDSFFTLGSANINQRSMAGDSELNMGCNDRKLAEGLRKRIWSQLSGKNIDGGSVSQSDLISTFESWVDLRNENRKKKLHGKPMIGFLLPVEDNRKSTIRLG